MNSETFICLHFQGVCNIMPSDVSYIFGNVLFKVTIAFNTFFFFFYQICHFPQSKLASLEREILSPFILLSFFPVDTVRRPHSINLQS